MKVKKLVDNILDAEKASNIFKLKFKNYSIWPYYRMYFYYKYSKDLKILDESSSSMKFSIKYILKIIKIFNLYKLFKNKKYFILEHPRSNKEGKDIYTDDLVQSLGKDNCSFFTFTQGGISDKENSPIVLDFLKIFSKLNSKLFYKFTKNKYFKENFQSFLNTINADDKNTYFSHYKRYYIEFIIQFYFYYFILKVKKIEKVYLTVYYYNLALVVAAKKLNIETIEIQHGVVSKYHLGYHFPYYETDFFPDKVYLFSEYWKRVVLYPKNTKLFNIGNSHLYSNKANDNNKESNTILIISQATIGKQLESFLLKNIEKLDKYNIFFKLHPNEFNNKEKKYNKLSNFNNITIVANEYSINELQNICEYQLGIYSTSIYEGIERNCKTILLEDSGIEYMADLIDRDIVKTIFYDECLNDKLKKCIPPREIIFFNEFDKDMINE